MSANEPEIDPRAVRVEMNDRVYLVDTIDHTALRCIHLRYAWRWQRVRESEMRGKLGLNLVLRAEDALRLAAED